MDFSSRAVLQEWMDEPCTYQDFRACLRDLEQSNRLTWTYRPTLSWLAQLLSRRGRQGEPLRIVDVGSGYGDMLRRLARWGRRRGVALNLIGVDLNPYAARAARAVDGSEGITWITGDAFSVDLAGGVDVVLSSLFTHHLTEPEIVRFLAWMERTARLGWFVNDLYRHPLPHHLYWLLARVARWHRFVQHDGPVSIRRSFSVADWQRMGQAAGLPMAEVDISHYFPARLCVGRLR
jgi:SAM-dependent methyltransferase